MNRASSWLIRPALPLRRPDVRPRFRQCIFGRLVGDQRVNPRQAHCDMADAGGTGRNRNQDNHDGWRTWNGQRDPGCGTGQGSPRIRSSSASARALPGGVSPRCCSWRSYRRFSRSPSCSALSHLTAHRTRVRRLGARGVPSGAGVRYRRPAVSRPLAACTSPSRSVGPHTAVTPRHAGSTCSR